MRLFYGGTAAATTTFGYDLAVNRWIVAFLVSLIAFCAGDFVWLGFVAKDFYASRLGALLLPEPNFAAAIVFYPLYIVGLLAFCVRPALAAGSWRIALLSAALFGLVAYATYDLSNLATLKGWSIAVTLVDIAWGMVVSSLAALAGYAAARIAAR
jgi:uncharacterized membrane protein